MAQKLISFLLCLTSPALVRGQPPKPTTDGPITTATGAFFALSVADVKTSARWYEEKLGLKVVVQAPKRDGVAVIVLEGGGLIVELIEHDDALTLSQPTAVAAGNFRVYGIVKTGAIVVDFEKTLTMLRQRGVQIAFGPFPATRDQRANVIVKDNSGNLIQFFGRIQGGAVLRAPPPNGQ